MFTLIFFKLGGKYSIFQRDTRGKKFNQIFHIQTNEFLLSLKVTKVRNLILY